MWDLHRLRLLRELELRGTVTAVAEALSYSPSSVSQQLAKLEAEVGSPLLEREGRRLALTDAGRAVAAHAAQIIASEERVRGELETLRPAVSGTIRIASLETVARALFPAALSWLRAAHPALRVELAVVPPEQGLAELESHRFDLVVAEQYPGHVRALVPGLTRKRLGLDPIRLAVPVSAPLLRIEDAAERAWISEPEGTAARAWVVQQCRAAGFEPDVPFLAADLHTHIELVSSGHAVSLLPDLVWWAGRRDIALVDLPGSPRRELFTVVRDAAESRPAVATVRQALDAAFQQLRTPDADASA